jgi:hypothetical protein
LHYARQAHAKHDHIDNVVISAEQLRSLIGSQGPWLTATRSPAALRNDERGWAQVETIHTTVRHLLPMEHALARRDMVQAMHPSG